MYVYKFINSNNEIIYIGKSKELIKRISNHIHLPKECYSETKQILCAKLNNVDEMSIYERYLINVYSPKYNKQYNNGSKFIFTLPQLEWEEFDNIEKEIVKDADFIYKPKCISLLYGLTLAQMKSINAIFMNYNGEKTIKVFIKDFIRDSGLKIHHSYIRGELDFLCCKKLQGHFGAVTLVDSIYYDENEGYLYVELNDSVFDDLEYVAVPKNINDIDLNKVAYRMYEMLWFYKDKLKQGIELEYNEVRSILTEEGNYLEQKVFMDRVFKSALEYIEKTDIDLKYEIFRGMKKRIKSIKFYV